MKTPATAYVFAVIWLLTAPAAAPAADKPGKLCEECYRKGKSKSCDKLSQLAIREFSLQSTLPAEEHLSATLFREKALAQIAETLPEFRKAAEIRLDTICVEIATSDNSPQTSLEAVRTIKSESQLVTVLNNNFQYYMPRAKIPIQIAAIQRITTPKVLASVVNPTGPMMQVFSMTGKDNLAFEPIITEALARIEGDELLVALVARISNITFGLPEVQNIYGRTRDAAIDKIDHFEYLSLLMDLLNGKEGWGKAHRRAKQLLDAMVDQQKLLNIALKENFEDIAHTACEKITDQDALAKVALSGRSKKARLSAIARLTDTNVILELVGKNETDIAQAGLAVIKDESLLATIVASDTIKSDIRLSALGLILNEENLSVIAVSSANSAIAEAACRRITSAPMLGRVAKDAGAPYARIVAVEGLQDMKVLLQFAQTDKDWRVRRAAASKLTGEADLLSIINQDSNGEVRRAAAGALPYGTRLPDEVLWLRAQARADRAGMQDYLKARPNGVHTAEAADWIKYPDVLQGELSLDFSVPFFSGSGRSSPSGMSINTNGRSYKIVLLETTKVPAGWNPGGVSMIEPGAYYVRGVISGKSVTAREIKKSNK